MALRTDVSSSAEIGRAVEAVLGRWGRIDILVNNAGGLVVSQLEPGRSVAPRELRH
jgi:NAD(P)-dependent dehydrogenase (short-subunit alcohol dehydrogenase family)